MCRLLMFFAVLAAAWGLTVAPAGAQTKDTVTLRPSVLVDDAYVTLGDIFAGLSDPLKAGKAVAYAPQPGKTSILDYRWLDAIAKREGVPWRPRTRQDAVSVERASQIIDALAIETEINDALVAQGIPGPIEVQLASQTFRLHLATDIPPTIRVDRLSANQRTNRWTGVIITGDGTDQARTYKLTGSYFPVISVPVTVRPIARGDIIEEDDVVYSQVRADRLQANVIRELTDVIGKEARRTLQTDTILSRRDVAIPILVKRNAIVSMSLRTPTMTISTKGRALENGGMGETVRVMNSDSRKTVEALVTGENRVEVTVPAF